MQIQMSQATGARNTSGAGCSDRAVLWLATVVVTLLTRSTTLVSTLVLLGSFLVPVSFVLWRRTVERPGRDGPVAGPLLPGRGLLGVWPPRCWRATCLRPSPWLFGGVRADRGGGELAPWS